MTTGNNIEEIANINQLLEVVITISGGNTENKEINLKLRLDSSVVALMIIGDMLHHKLNQNLLEVMVTITGNNIDK